MSIYSFQAPKPKSCPFQACAGLLLAELFLWGVLDFKSQTILNVHIFLWTMLAFFNFSFSHTADYNYSSLNSRITSKRLSRSPSHSSRQNIWSTFFIMLSVFKTKSFKRITYSTNKRLTNVQKNPRFQF